MGSMISDQGGVKATKETSDKVHTAVGSGSRPTKSKVMIESSAPMDPHTLGRAPKDWLE
jgi:hypothetical protein